MRPAADAAPDRFPVTAGVGGPGQHRIFGRDPAQAAPPAPARDPLERACRAEHPGGPELDERQAFAMTQPVPADLNPAALIRSTAAASGRHAGTRTGSYRAGLRPPARPAY